ncbi:MAG: class I SAM-dependent methyltransferase [Candidatus ainarchaeum sp.]|nr:class I SAM-dependent methyltransferase [Candidatus ainarchaeum sp.]MDD3975937.1 class I SAM-dependent methyltransferase [Candidatus ainarchaeum sp.]
MEEVKKFYDIYNYPNLKLYTYRQKRNHKKLILKILSYINFSPKDLKNKDVLDFGCGTGDKSIFFAEYFANVTSIDFSKGQLSVLNKKIKENNIKNITVYQKDLIKDDLCFLKKYDIIFCIGVLHHTENPYLGFEKLTKLLKPNGIILIALYHRYSRIRFRIIRFFLKNLISKDFNKLYKWFFSSKKTFFLRKNVSKNTLYDRYIVPYESYHSLKEVKKWFFKNNIFFLKCSENVKGFEFFKIFEKKTLFFVSGIKK